MLEHEPTKNDRKTAQNAAGLGLPHEQIAALIGISDKTLRKHYGKELALGKAQASAHVAKSLFNKATNGDTTAMIWWTNAQMGWGETNKTVLQNPDGTNVEGFKIIFKDGNESI
jgi:hypothetical protein